ncbi:MAG: hypothetical protein Hyperionvirus24_29 [Hyperionvirus sp.]|uniref:MORN repeat-containing protein n=1 Tax=Hyperionvirus sp. TaxID=2487770 RepID=A0A3G5AB39_9VIRU|nr:MAG: hypothetical protein Hyperionvirus24_29 [Hyperionvirus sp.]
MRRTHIFREDGSLFESFEVNGKGEKDGVLVRFHGDGTKLVHCHYKNGVRNGGYGRWFLGGQQKISCDYADGVRKGEYTKWDSFGDVVERRLYKKGEIMKVRNYVCRGAGSMELNEEYENGILTGRKIVTIFGLNKERVSVGEYTTFGVMDGKFMYWVRDVKISEIIFVGGKKHGEQYYYHMGSGWMYKFMTYNKGLRDGSYMEWNEGGQIVREANYKSDSLHGLCKVWYPGGMLKCHVVYVEGKVRSIVALNDEKGNSCVISELNSIAWGAGYIFDHETKTNRFAYIRFAIPYGAKRLTIFSDNFVCRVSAVTVIDIVDLSGKSHKEAKSLCDKKMEFGVGKVIISDQFDTDILKPDGEGIKVHLHQEHCNQWFQKLMPFLTSLFKLNEIQ